MVMESPRVSTVWYTPDVARARAPVFLPFLDQGRSMRLPKWPWRLRAQVHRKTASTLDVPGPDARRWAVLLVLVLGVLVLTVPHAETGWQPWGPPWQRWQAAQADWAHTAQATTQQESDALTDARRVQSDLDACQTPQPDRMAHCLQRLAPAQGSLGQLLTVQAWGRLIDQATGPEQHALVQQGLLAVDRLQALSSLDTRRWNTLAESFQQALNACRQTWPGMVCSLWARPDEQTWGLLWDPINGVVLPPDDAQVVPEFVREHRTTWTTLLATSSTLSTRTPGRTLSSQGRPIPDDNPRAWARSSSVRERPGRFPRTD